MPLTTRFNLGFVATLLFCLFYLNLSYTVGHLSHDMTWDDISYALSAVDRSDTLIRSGLYDFLLSWTKPYPHSVYSELAAIISVFLFGINDFGFYVFNFLLLIAIFFFLYNNFLKNDRITFALIFLFVMLSTISYSIIDNFRPDFALGLATTGLVWWILQGIFFGRQRDFLWGGLALASALLIKPTFFAHTLAVATGLAVLAILIQIAQKKYYRELDTRPASALIYILFGIIIAVPYYILAGSDIFDYFWTNTRGEQSSIWSFSEEISPYNVLISYISDGYLNNGGMQVPVAVLISLALSPILYFYGKRRELIVVLLLLIVAACSLGVMIFGRHKSQFFFATFHMLIMLSAVYAVASASKNTSGISKALLLSAFSAAIIFTTAQNHRYLFIDAGRDSLKSVSENRTIVDQITRALAKSRRASSVYDKPASVLVTVAGTVNLPTIRWEARKAGFFITGKDIFFSNKINEYLELARRSDFVVLPYRMEAEYIKNFPGSPLQAELAILLMQDPEFRTLPSRGPHGHYLVLQRISPKSNVVFDINVPGNRSGFGPEEGPYPQWNLPRVAWMSSQTAEVCLYESGDYRLEMEARTPEEANVTLSSSRGILLANRKFNPDEFQVISVRHTISTEDPCIAIKYDASVHPSGGTNYLLFSKLKITKVKE
ncbi:hypothetical protein NBH20_03250 [Rhizobium sp. S153]|uniref:Glycosyltransferase RgtA/B/C/D-like domain-containing protein n=1 Tax=Ciceribacter sichuanensis TaxID=2949647 RepID=A0ABT0V2P7_9HYPH|nr:hypothetical protein [Ciceribacter sp. S153]MCM2400155.1 hypothetical protein [Ciceribacter sp. S153]